MSIHFHKRKVSFIVEHEKAISNWLRKIAAQEEYSILKINYIICNDEELLEINKQYLNHDYYTDIITFNLSEQENVVAADIFISMDRITDNAKAFNQKVEHELLRILSHGILHLIGFNDKTKNEQKRMSNKENECIKLFYNILNIN